MKKVISMVMEFVRVFSFATTVFADEFDYKTVLGSRSGYDYDKFDKHWSYYQAYVEHYNDGDVVIGISAWGVKGGSNLDDTELYVKVLDTNGEPMWTVESIAFLVGEDLYSYSSMSEGSTSSTVFIGKNGQALIKALADCDPSDVAVKIESNKGSYLTIDLDAAELTRTLKEFCRVYSKYNMFDYSDDTTFLEYAELMYPLYINGVAASEMVEETQEKLTF